MRRRNDGTLGTINADSMMTSRAVNGDDSVANVLARSPRAARLLLDRGMHCVGCPIAPFETIAEACTIYGVSLDTLLVDLAGVPAIDRREQS